MTEQGLIDWLNVLATKKYILEEKKKKFDEENADLMLEIKEIEKNITEAVLAKGESVKADKITAIWVKGKTTWDGKLLEGYALAHPDILAAKNVGSPTVSFRKITK